MVRRRIAVLATVPPSPQIPHLSRSQVLKEVLHVPAGYLDRACYPALGPGVDKAEGIAENGLRQLLHFSLSCTQSKHNLPSVPLPSGAQGRRLEGREEKVTGHIE